MRARLTEEGAHLLDRLLHSLLILIAKISSLAVKVSSEVGYSNKVSREAKKI
ncbi:hypothetical protein [Neobacillus massiliamazoniensis]|uniref:hypothetical protein n=1 Tax=Neobacillus massiliamazoniensis TaxID=1499688 RepID=UPI000A7949D2|nr:hypothetical protein [Neobacillus massiliamazoniensis]